MRPVRWGAILLALVAAVSWPAAQSPSPASTDPPPQTLEQFRAMASGVLEETGVPGAGIALVRLDGVEWEGGLGYADRDQRTPVNAHTHFRVGSVSKTFVAMSLVQLSEDGLVDLDTPVEELAPEIAIDNPWHDSHPVRVIHLLQHTAGFDDMHFNGVYVPPGQPELSLHDALLASSNTRRVRWQPGTRMAYSNPGYGVAGFLIEKIAGVPYEDYIKREIFDPLGMTTSSFHLTSADERHLAQGYSGAMGPPVGYPRIYLRPAGNMHSSPHEMGRFVRMLLGWGELDTAFVIDPEYLGNMEQPRTTLAAAAGLRNGYGTGIATTLTLPYRVNGHGGGIDGFTSTYGYSPSRDVGYVILLNSAGGRTGEAIGRLSSLAIQYLKRNVEPPTKPEHQVDSTTLDQYVGYYHDANPRNQVAWAVQTLFAGRTIVRDAGSLYARPVIGERVRLIPVSDTLFRLDNELDASRVFTVDGAGSMVLAGTAVYAERRPRWQIEIVRVPVLTTLPVVFSVFVVGVVWVARIRHARPRGFWDLKVALLFCPILLLIPFATLALTPNDQWGMRNGATVALFLATLALPAFAVVVAALALGARAEGASQWLSRYAITVALAMVVLSVYMGAYDLLGLRMWSY